MRAPGFPTRSAWVAAAAGLLWAQVGIALVVAVLPRYLGAGERVTQGPWWRLASWTLLAPLSLACAATGRQLLEPSRLELAASALIGVGLCAAWSLASRAPEWRLPTAGVLVLAAALGVVSAGVLGVQLRDAALADRAFFALLSDVGVPQADPAVVAGARTFVARYPHSRWTGEALRIIAMSESDAGRVGSAAALWRRFGESFASRDMPGVAYAEYNLALCERRLGRTNTEAAHLRAAIGTIRARGDGVQSWIAVESARRLSYLERAGGRYALADYWNLKSETFSDVYPNE